MRKILKWIILIIVMLVLGFAIRYGLSVWQKKTEIPAVIPQEPDPLTEEERTKIIESFSAVPGGKTSEEEKKDIIESFGGSEKSQLTEEEKNKIIESFSQ